MQSDNPRVAVDSAPARRALSRGECLLFLARSLLGLVLILAGTKFLVNPDASLALFWIVCLWALWRARTGPVPCFGWQLGPTRTRFHDSRI